MELLCLTFTASSLRDPKVFKLLQTICLKMTQDCEADEPIRVLNACDVLIREKKMAYPYSCCMFILTDGRQVLSTALVTCCRQISFRWTPPQHRKKGYALQMTKMIEESWKSTKVLPLWVASNDYMKPLNEKAGWVNDGLDNQDGTLDWFPSWCADRYKKAVDDRDEDISIVDNARRLIVEEVYTDNELSQAKDWGEYLKQFPPLLQRKKAQHLRV